MGRPKLSLHRFAFLFFLPSLFHFGCAGSGNELSPALVALLAGGVSPNVNSVGTDHQSANGGPELNDLTVTTNYVVGSEDSQSIRVKVSLKKQVSYPVTFKAYLGRPTILRLKPDGISVTTYIDEENTLTGLNQDEFLFLSPETSMSYKIIVIAESERGYSAKEIISNPPPPPAGPCAGAVAAPVVVGNCADHCIEVTRNGTNMGMIARYNNPSDVEYLYLDLSTSSPGGASGPVPFQYIEQIENVIPAGQYATPNAGFDTNAYTGACVDISSYRVRDGASGFSDSYIVKRIIVP
ncbi:hypothetical protein [Leptospira adleri]|uniref:hypothetical protein n=1 Tax=Leptospira adleri TaxID=2023186 RepID=UPI001082F35A|nr:hypothetical protein [Leptospira adleri]TGM52833.1 hypothetical protein EHQ97_13005 [Leptospira adleri]